MPEAAYCTEAQVLSAAGLGAEPASTVVAALVASLIPQVEDMIDQATGTWWNSKSKTLYLQPPPYTNALEMPAPIITLTSVTEEGALLDAHDYVNAKTHLEREGGTSWASLPYDNGTTLEYPVIVVATAMGYATVPDRIVRLASDLVAILAGLKTRTYIDEDGVKQAVTSRTTPDYVKQVLAADTHFDLSGVRWHE